MKQIISSLIIICSLFLFSSCNKPKNDSNSTNYYMSAKVGGVLNTYKLNAVAVKVQVDTIYSIGLTAFGDTTTGARFFLDIGQTNKAITTGTYIDAAAPELLVVGGYNPGTMDDTKMYGAGLQVDSNPRLSITISALTATTVTGTFSGTYYDNGGDGPGIIAVTEGKFNLPLY
jgi:hypothetical protein